MTRKGDTDHYKGVIIRGAAPYLLSLSSVCWQRDKRSPADKGEEGNHRSFVIFIVIVIFIDIDCHFSSSPSFVGKGTRGGKDKGSRATIGLGHCIFVIFIVVVILIKFYCHSCRHYHCLSSFVGKGTRRGEMGDVGRLSVLDIVNML